MDEEAGAARRDLAERVVKFMAKCMERESAFLSPAPNTVMNDPYGLLDLLRDECNLDPETIDKWMCEAQGIDPNG